MGGRSAPECGCCYHDDGVPGEVHEGLSCVFVVRRRGEANAPKKGIRIDVFCVIERVMR